MCWWNFQDDLREGPRELSLREFRRLIDELAILLFDSYNLWCIIYIINILEGGG